MSTSWQWAKANPDAAARRIRNLETENAALREDKERLDWLEEGHAWPEYIDAEWHSKGQVFLSFRDAIDTARAKEGQL
jgi:plasmid stabilization system protein ParE